MLRVLELFSGIGGMHCALDFLEIEYEILAAIDINPTANSVYHLNFPKVPIVNRTIETIPFEKWEKWSADVWLMSPPCQPFTRQGKQDDLDDRRTDGFVYLIKEVLPRLEKKPKYFLLENVAGFEQSRAHRMLIEILEENQYSSHQYLLSPVQFGIPNSRLRFYLTAVRSTSSTSQIENRLLNFDRSLNKLRQHFPIENLTDDENQEILSNDRISSQCSLASEILVQPNESLSIEPFLTNRENSLFELNEKQIQRGLHVSDCISVRSKRSFCFTKAYGKYFEGTGSLISTPNGRVRFFAPKEIANLHLFPSDFQFPEELSVRQQYAVLGNSLNVFVVAALLENLFGRS